jgi:nucleotidyltransferase substrate binding protein (TIGR01987 family)
MARDPDIRWHQRLQSFRKAFGQLSKAAATAAERELTELEQQGLIQTFEFTHELAWKTMNDFLKSHGTAELYGSKDATREAFAKGLIEDGDAWMAMIESRNQTSHTYNEETADQIANAIFSRYVAEFETFLRRFTEMEKDER